jgi:hypothetical protein
MGKLHHYPLVTNITMDHHHLQYIDKSTISMAMFHGYVNLPEGTPTRGY